MVLAVPDVVWLGTNNTDRTVTVAVNGSKYEYWVRGNFEFVERRFRLLERKAPGKALNYIKKNASRCDKL